MKLVSWRYPAGAVVMQLDRGRFRKAVTHAIGMIVGDWFIGATRADQVAEEIRPGVASGPLIERLHMSAHGSVDLHPSHYRRDCRDALDEIMRLQRESGQVRAP